MKLKEKNFSQFVFIPLPKSDSSISPVNENNLIFQTEKCFTHLHRIIWPLKIIAIWNRLKPSLIQGNFNVIHAHSLFVNGTIAYFCKRSFGIPYVVTIRNSDINTFMARGFIFRNWGWIIMKHAARITTLSHTYFDVHLRKYYNEKRFSIIKAKHSVIPNGAEDFWFENVPAKSNLENPVKILFVGLISKNKNLDAVIRVCTDLSEENIQLELHIAGDGPRAEEFKSVDYPFPVQFYGHIKNRSDLRELYRKTDLLFVPSFTESFGIAYVEAISQGLPVIYTKNQGFDGFFPNGTIGFAVDPFNTDEMKEAVKNIITHYVEISESAIKRAIKFKWDEPVELLKNCYNSVS